MNGIRWTRMNGIRGLSGSAAGCEAGLRPAGVAWIEKGWAPGTGSAPTTFRAKPERGAEPQSYGDADGGAKPRLTSGGGAAATTLQYTDERSRCKNAAAHDELSRCKSAAAHDELSRCHHASVHR